MAAACALAIISGIGFLFGIQKSLRAFLNPLFTGGNSLSQSLMALPAPSGREPLAKPETLRLSREVYRHAKGPIPEGAGIAQR